MAYSDRQVSLGLQALLFGNYAGFAHAVAGADVNDALKSEVVKSLLPLYRDCLAKRSPPVLGHRNESAGNPLEFIGNAVAQIEKVNARIARLVQQSPDAAAYRPGSIL